MSRHRWRRILPWLALLGVGLAAAALRHGLIEPAAVAQQCRASDAAWWCAARQWLIFGFLHNAYGAAALALAAVALVWKQAPIAWLAAALGAFALPLYGVQCGALALLIGCLRLLRIQAAHTNGIGGDRQRQRQIQA